eukprot:a4092_22.p1 GENE.a4092_22~~a4092_22.p1  ORF type:complete len:308 (+),score=54.08 a4092_22:36-926(+)
MALRGSPRVRAARRSALLSHNKEFYMDGGGPVELDELMAILSQCSEYESLNLPRSRIGFEGAQLLAEALPSTRLCTLVLSFAGISNRGCSVLAAVLPATQIRLLNISGNESGDIGICDLAAILPRTAICHLELAANNIGDEGAAALAAALPTTISIQTINLSYNAICDDGAAELARALMISSHIQRFRVEGNRLSAAGVEAFLFDAPLSHLASVARGSSLCGEVPRRRIEVLGARRRVRDVVVTIVAAHVSDRPLQVSRLSPRTLSLVCSFVLATVRAPQWTEPWPMWQGLTTRKV